MNQTAELLYEGLIDDTKWNLFIDELNHELDADCGCIISSSRDGMQPELAVMRGGCEKNISQYASKLYLMDPFVNLKNLTPYSIDELISEKLWEQSDFYQLVVADSGLHHFLGMDIAIDEQIITRIRFGRARARGRFKTQDKELLASFGTHIKRVASIHRKMGDNEAETAFYRKHLERLAIGCLSVDSNMNIDGINESALNIINRNRLLSIKNNKFLIADATFSNSLSKSIAEVSKNLLNCNTSLKNAVSYSPPCNSDKVTITVQAKYGTHTQRSFNRPMYLLSIYDHNKPATISTEALRNLYSLTKQESIMCMHLANDLSIDETAEILGIKRNTAKAHLRAIFIKMGVSRQSQLVSLVLKNGPIND